MRFHPLCALAVALALVSGFSMQAVGSVEAREPIRGAGVTLGKNTDGGAAKWAKNQKQNGGANATVGTNVPAGSITAVSVGRMGPGTGRPPYGNITHQRKP